MKKLLTAAVLIVLTATAHAQQPLDRAQEYRMWSAERTIERLEAKFGKAIAGHPVLTGIREIAANGDDVDWARLIEAVHHFEDTTPKATR